VDCIARTFINLEISMATPFMFSQSDQA